NVTDLEIMIMKIKAIQSEKDYLLMLLAEYIDNIVIDQNAHAIKLYKDSLWSLIANLSFAFDYSNSTTYHLFENAPEIIEEGIKNILSFYETGKLHFQEVLEEDVYKTKLQTS
ncbi:4090_t:CDS:1, partial [Racocetra fulgida]